jgi:GGDEF domain-containing protein
MGDPRLPGVARLKQQDAAAGNRRSRLQDLRLHVGPFAIEGQELATSVSAGIAVYSGDGQDDSLLKKADTAIF